MEIEQHHSGKLTARLKIIGVVAICWFFFSPLSVCRADFKRSVEWVREFLEKQVNPVILHVYQEVAALIHPSGDVRKSKSSLHRFVDLNSRFVKNAITGQLFVVSGQVVFGRDQDLDRLGITVSLLNQNRQAFMSETVICGNRISEAELATMDAEQIKLKLREKHPSAQIVKKGLTQPFMAVFSNFSIDQIDQFKLSVDVL